MAINDLVEEEVTLLIDETIVTCFATYLPYEIEVGNSYTVELTLNLADHYEIQKNQLEDFSASRIGSGFSYILCGKLSDNFFQTFTWLSDEGIHYDHPDMNDCFIKLVIDRIDVTFH
ncbi:hypothetical protein BFW87_23330 [Pseudomonas fluorescens]|uniref:Uncharacterized protein n=2 Tax=Pseudomonas fluorescens TaxID=294 RepID=A0A1T2Y7P2_PSEFL|nr:hypothetical protein BFW87_23330 [Pseudomonas fluorescens]